MVIDVMFTDGSGRRLVLPGSTLGYGHTSTMDKAAALLWAMWLIAGPSLDDLDWFCDNVRSLTTDFGVEMHLLEVPDIKEAMIAWAGGLPLMNARLLVKADRRCFRRALRIAGWSHTMGNTMMVETDEYIQSSGPTGNFNIIARLQAWLETSKRTNRIWGITYGAF